MPQAIEYYITPNDCHICVSHRIRRGYPMGKIKKRESAMSRCMYQLFVRKLTRKEVVMHICDNPLCINIDHLTIGSQRDNMQDKENKGRGRYGPNRNTIQKALVQLPAIKKSTLSTAKKAKIYKLPKEWIVDIERGNTHSVEVLK